MQPKWNVTSQIMVNVTVTETVSTTNGQREQRMVIIKQHRTTPPAERYHRITGIDNEQPVGIRQGRNTNSYSGQTSRHQAADRPQNARNATRKRTE
jgi:hypothetical protein